MHEGKIILPQSVFILTLALYASRMNKAMCNVIIIHYFSTWNFWPTWEKVEVNECDVNYMNNSVRVYVHRHAFKGCIYTCLSLTMVKLQFTCLLIIPFVSCTQLSNTVSFFCHGVYLTSA